MARGTDLEVHATPHAAVAANLADLGPGAILERTQLQRRVDLIAAKLILNLLCKHLHGRVIPIIQSTAVTPPEMEKGAHTRQITICCTILLTTSSIPSYSLRLLRNHLPDTRYHTKV